MRVNRFHPLKDIPQLDSFLHELFDELEVVRSGSNPKDSFLLHRIAIGNPIDRVQ